MFECVPLDERDEHLGIESVFGAVKTVRHFFDFGDDCFVGCLRCIWVVGYFLVGCFDECFPCGGDVGFVSVVSCFVDEEADIMIVCCVRVIIEELDEVSIGKAI